MSTTTATTLPAIGARVEIIGDETKAALSGYVSGYGSEYRPTEYDHDGNRVPAHSVAVVLVRLADGLWTADRGHYVSLIVAHPDNIRPS